VFTGQWRCIFLDLTSLHWPNLEKMAGLSLEAFIELLGEVGIPAVDYPPDELEKEMTAAL
jgi:hypothetical protein